MELIINDKVCELKGLNQERKAFFISRVLSFYNYEADSFQDHIQKTQEYLKKVHKIKMKLIDVEKAFIKDYQKSVKDSIWTFLKPSDKIILKSTKHISITAEQIKLFIENICNKIKELSSYINEKKGNTTKEDTIFVYSYISRFYGWTIEQIKDMDELEMMKSLEYAIELSERENVNKINSQALAGAYVGGSKEAKTQIDSLNRKTKRKQKIDPKNLQDNSLSFSEIEKIMNSDNG